MEAGQTHEDIDKTCGENKGKVRDLFWILHFVQKNSSTQRRERSLA